VLHELGADVNKGAQRGDSPVLVAAIGGQAECIWLLRELGADINSCNTVGLSPAYVAVEKGRVECIRLLHELGANIDACTPFDASPMSMAAEDDKADCVRLCIQLGASVRPLLDAAATAEGDADDANFWADAADAIAVVEAFPPRVMDIVEGVRTFLDVTALYTSPR
jgi:ankyrin repeat protein